MSGAATSLLRRAGSDDPVALVVDAGAGHGARVRFFGPAAALASAEEATLSIPERVAPRWGARLDDAPDATLMPGAGFGHEGAPALEFLRADGRWRFRPGQVHLASAADGAIVVRQRDDDAGLDIEQTLALDPDSGALALRAHLRNVGDDAVDLRWLAVGSLPLPRWCTHAEAPTGDWCDEFRIERTALSGPTLLRERREGRSSHACPPCLLLTEGEVGVRHGRALALQFAWSGDHRWRIDRCADGTDLLQVGVLLQPGEVTLVPGEELETPTLWLAASARGRDGVTARAHALQRALLPTSGMRRPRPVHLNTWEAVYFDHDPDALVGLAEAAAALGVERFVLDDGWFLGRTDDRRALGDWTVDPVRYPRGLEPLVARVRALGMGFGLWVEPEMVNDDSELARAHPDWLRGPRDGAYAAQTGRHQRVLDLTLAPVRAHLLDALSALLTAHPIEYLKWDHNRVLTELAAAGSAGHRAQTLALYALLDALRARHPEVEIESCASGGGRADLGMLARCHRVWTSDCNDPIRRTRIMTGAAPWLPPEVAGCHVGPERAHTTGRSTTLDFRAAVALLGTFGLEQDVRELDAEERTQLAGHIERYKRWRDVLHGGALSTQTPDADHVVRQATARDGGRALLIVLRVGDARPTGALQLPLVDLRVDRDYRVRLSAPVPSASLRPGALVDAQRFLGDGQRVSGAWLADVGLTLQLPAPERAVVLELEAL